MKLFFPLLGQLADLLSTFVGIYYFGATEGNPLVAATLEISPWLTVGIKITLGCVGGLALWEIQRKGRTGDKECLFFTAFGVLPAAWNTFSILYLILSQ